VSFLSGNSCWHIEKEVLEVEDSDDVKDGSVCAWYTCDAYMGLLYVVSCKI